MRWLALRIRRQVARLAHAQVRLVVVRDAERRKRPFLPEVEYALYEGALLEVRLRRELHLLVDYVEEQLVVARGAVCGARQVQRDVLERAVAHLPRMLRLVEVLGRELEGEAAALGELRDAAAVEYEVCVALL